MTKVVNPIESQWFGQQIQTQELGRESKWQATNLCQPTIFPPQTDTKSLVHLRNNIDVMPTFKLEGCER